MATGIPTEKLMQRHEFLKHIQPAAGAEAGQAHALCRQIGYGARSLFAQGLVP
jgi:hypothetical protein